MVGCDIASDVPGRGATRAAEGDARTLPCDVPGRVVDGAAPIGRVAADRRGVLPNDPGMWSSRSLSNERSNTSSTSGLETTSDDGGTLVAITVAGRASVGDTARLSPWNRPLMRAPRSFAARVSATEAGRGATGLGAARAVGKRTCFEVAAGRTGLGSLDGARCARVGLAGTSASDGTAARNGDNISSRRRPGERAAGVRLGDGSCDLGREFSRKNDGMATLPVGALDSVALLRNGDM